tara:strand:+ start:174 stop:2060 length:1887 start_codon:yes stop_codon:yes gene_type:complete
MAEVLELQVKTNIKGTVKEVDSLAASLKKANTEASNLTQQISIQNKVLNDMKKELIELKRVESQDSPWVNSLKGTTEKIKDLTHEIALEENALKDLNNQQKDNNAVLKDTTNQIKKKTDATKKGTPVSKAAALAMKGIGTAMKAMGIGLIIAAFMLLKKALMSNKTIMDAVEKVTTAVGNIMSDFVAVIVDTYNWVTSSTDRFDSMGKVITGLINMALIPLKAQFYFLKLGVLALMLGFYEMKNAMPGINESAKIKDINSQLRQTAKDIKDIPKGAVASFKSVVSNAKGAVNEFGAVVSQVTTGMGKITIDTEKRNEEVVDSEERTAGSIKTIGEDLLKFKERLAEQQAKNEKQTEKEKIQAQREAHLAELNALEINAEEKARLTEELNTLYDQQEKDRQKEVDDTEAAELAEIEEENFLLEIEDLTERALARVEIERLEALAGVAEHENRLEMEAALNKKYDKAKEALGKKELTWEKMNANEKLGIAADTFGNLSKVLGEESAAGKAMAVAQATISTYLGATKAYTAMLSVGPAGPVLGAIAAAAAVASGLANVNAIMSTPIPGGGGGGGGGPQPDVPAATPAPEMMSGAFELGGAEEVEPVQAYVVSDEISETQDGLALIRRRATI